MRKKVQPKPAVKEGSTSSEKANKTIQKVLDELKEVLDRNLGSGEYMSYFNVVWDKKIDGANSNYTGIRCLSSLDSSDDEHAELQVSNLTDSVTSDPFIVTTVLQDTLATFLLSKFGTSLFEMKKQGDFNSTSNLTEEIQ